MKKRILITGGFGFVGGRLAEHLVLTGHSVVLGSRIASEPPNWLPQAELAQTLWDDKDALQQICGGVDVVIHAAGMNIQDCSRDPVAALAFNGLATARFVAAASQAGVQKFIYLSTAHVYADPLVGRITEESCPRNVHPYATSHLAGEQAVFYALSRNPISGGVLRLSNGFGAPAHRYANCWNLFVNNICKQVVTKHQAVVHNDSGKHYDFLPMNELVRAVQWFADLDAQLSDSENRKLMNIGAGRSTTLEDMARLVQSRCSTVLGFTPRISSNQKVSFEPLYYDSIYGGSVSIGNSTTTVEEIDRLLRYCSATFKEEIE